MFVILQFAHIPDSEERTALEKEGVHLLDYIPNNAYTAVVKNQLAPASLLRSGVTSVVELSASQKMEPGLASGKIPAHAIKSPGTVDIWLNYPKTFSFDEITELVKDRGYVIVSDLYKTAQIITVRVPESEIVALASSPFVQYLQPIPGADKPINNKSTVNGRANVLGSSLSIGRNLKGAGVVVGVGDDSNPYQHIDFNNRIINHMGIAGGTHGVHVMGTLGGAGIMDEKYKGFAPLVTMLSQYFSNIFALAGTYVKDYGMVITNNSYGADVNTCLTLGTYDLYSYVLDQQSFQFPYLQHVFASGNSGSMVCSPNPSGFGNILGGYQTAKNVITVGNTNDEGFSISTSSRGPVKDGRIKPEIMAQGTLVVSTSPTDDYATKSGTSMAAPAVSGGLALLNESYRKKNSSNPKNGLLKALICNGATDRGNEGPDHKYGFGWMNLLRSLKMLEAEAYKNDSVYHGDTKEFTITIPANSAQVKVMLYWNDPAAAVFSSQNLVNNLDLKVRNPSGNTVLPLVLSTDPTKLALLAAPGVDNVNNIEQVVINNPVEGTYTISVKGSSIVQNPRQEYFVVYDIIPVSTTLTYPIGKESLVKNDVITISWDSYGNTSSTYTVEYSVDNGANWLPIGSNLVAATRQLSWTVPDVITDKARVRVTQSGSGTQSVSEPFTILGIPEINASDVQCEGYFAVEWGAVSGATDYEVMILSGDEMVRVVNGITTSTRFTINGLSKDSTYYVSVRARLNENPGRRALAIKRKPDNGNCTGTISDNDLKLDAIVTPATSGRKFTSTELSASQSVTVRIKNLDDAGSTDAFTINYAVNETVIYSQTINPLIAAGGTYDHTFPVTADLSAIGTYQIKVILSRGNDPVTSNNVITKTFKQLANPSVTLPFTDDLESLSKQSIIGTQVGLDGGDRYDFTTNVATGRIRSFVSSGISYSGTKALTLDSYKYSSGGVTNYLMATLDLSAYTPGTNDVRLDFVYKNHGQSSDGANKVWIRGKDTDSWIQAYDLYANQKGNDEGYKAVYGLELSRLLQEQSKLFTSSFQIRWGQWGENVAADKTRADGYTIDDIHVYTIIDDMQMLSISSPVAEKCTFESTEGVTVTVRNSSSGVIADLPVKLVVDNGSEITEHIYNIPARSNMDYTFTAKADFSAPGRHTLKVSVAYPTDNYAYNNELTKEYYHSPAVTTLPYLQDFETNDGYWHAEGAFSSWQYGIPSAPKISRAASGRKAWKTGLTGNHNDYELSYLYSPCFSMSGVAAPTLSFSMALDIEVCDPNPCDIAYVEYSGDGGSWTRLGAVGQGTNWYNKTFSDAGSWCVKDYINWHVATIALPTGFSTIRLRFVMSSDAFVSREGIAIDDIHVYDKPNGIYDETSITTAISQTVSASENWSHFLKNNKLVASIKPGSQNLGTTNVQANINTSGVRNTIGQYYHDRSITIKPQTTSLTDSVTLRLYFLDTETENLLSATSCSGCGKPVSAYELGVSEYTSSNKNLEDGDISNNNGGSWLFHSGVRKVPFDKGYFAEFKVKGFSEFWLSKALIGNSAALPVRLISFSAKRLTDSEASEDVLLVWKTAMEENADHFDIEVAVGDDRLKKGDFSKIGEIKAKGNWEGEQSYSLTDNEMGKSDTRYYRLKMVDMDGSFAYSVIRPVLFNEQPNWHIYPNPSKEIFNVVAQANDGELIKVKVLDESGRTLLTTSARGNGFLQKHKIDLSGSAFSSGLYLFEVSSEKDKQVFKVVKE
ncbi:hypothetical protein DYBT9275_00189 [Dyadobacter sp. CECT 9275]|uniref:Por secretion system C-terminal sorting domain-containing protein n=1 Tax=Dyadobacter helix TaxID=2822344 RepID=A0A916J7W5_9BACT|nr:S8 family serine peptidase [Dyadobacter sp. CECT 9275]CAG4988935.1 hypothetical protein DYBT9275_00189 [Dyadobacter sp. CECT 9275]